MPFFYGVSEIFPTPFTIPLRTFSFNTAFALFSPSSSMGDGLVKKHNCEWSSGGDKYPILPFTGEILYRCFTGRQKRF